MTQRSRQSRPPSSRPGPHAVAPQLATLVDAAPEGDGWLHEIKYDGYRLHAIVEDGAVRLITRNGKDWTAQYPAVATELAELPAEAAVLDGEVVVVRADGKTSFQALQNVQSGGSDGVLRFMAFDLLHLDGADVAREPLEARKALLEVIVGGLAGVAVHYSDHVEGQGPAFHAQACRLGLEGIISKRRTAPYQSGRGRDWLKVKCMQEQEFVIAGYTEPQGSRAGFGALWLGAHDESGRLLSVGKVGTGFDDALLRSLHRRLRGLERRASALQDPPRGAQARGVRWVRPELVAQVAFTGFTNERNLRHPTFRGLREDKPAGEVVFESPALSADASTEEDMAKRGGAGRKKAGGKQAAGGSTRRGAAGAGRKKAGASAATSSRGRGRVDVAGVSLSNPDKVLYADQQVTKLDLAHYYESVADWILPHIQDRPLTLVRCPSGYGDCFYQKHIDESAHDAIARVPIPGDAQPYGAVRTLEGIVALVQLGVLELHTWGARRDRVERPDRLILDLDPDPSVPWERVVAAARQVREAFRLLELESFVKTTGGKGLHVVVPFRRGPDWDEVKAFSKAVAEAVSGASPGEYTLNISKAKRRGRILIDYLRNGQGATAIEAYSTRARPGAPVAVPLSWEELGPDVREDHFNLRNVAERLASLARDPWNDYAAVKQSITATVRKKVGAI